MIKPHNRKRVGIAALLINTLALGYTLYTKQTELAKISLYINSFAIVLWFTSEGFFEFLLAKYLGGKNDGDK